MKRHKYNPDYAQELLRLAKADFAAAHAVLQAGVRVENACFFYQQTVEKSLKAVLIKSGVAIPAVHDLKVLLALFPSEGEQPPFEHELAELNIYAAQRRYEEGPAPATAEDGEDAHKMAEALLVWASRLTS